jgi:hypothetical protein
MVSTCIPGEASKRANSILFRQALETEARPFEFVCSSRSLMLFLPRGEMARLVLLLAAAIPLVGMQLGPR